MLFEWFESVASNLHSIVGYFAQIYYQKFPNMRNKRTISHIIEKLASMDLYHALLFVGIFVFNSAIESVHI